MGAAVDLTETGLSYDVEAIRADFPIFREKIHGKPLSFLDSAASAQKPQAVLDQLMRTYTTRYANVHRGAYFLSEAATADYEAAREKVRAFINASGPGEVVFTRNATEALNLVAHSWGSSAMKAGDAVIISDMEHHSNIVPWQLLRDQIGIELRVCPITDSGELRMDALREMLDDRVRMVSITHVSNVLGTVTPVEEIIRLAHDAGALVMLDGCQAIQHMNVDVQALDVDFYAFSSHKLYGPTGVGVLYGKEALLDAMPPFLGGGDMISSVTYERSTWAALPAKFEAGTPTIAEAIGFGAAIDYVAGVGLDRIAAHERDLLNYTTQKLASINGLTIYGTAPGKVSVISFALEAAHPHDVATILDRSGVAVRAGHHCAEPLLQRLGVHGLTRASFGMYSTRAEADALASGLEKVKEIFA